MNYIVIISLNLFSIFVNETPRVAGIRLLLFADGTAVVLPIVKANVAAVKFQRQLNACVE